jgi:uncharacterized repeat protein (TIGR03803 family)
MFKQLLLVLFCSWLGAKSQTVELWGTTMVGGVNSTFTNSGGTLYKINGDGTGFQVLHAFSGLATPLGALLQTPDGKVYGTTFNSGVAYCYNPVTAGFSNIHQFGGGVPGWNIAGDLYQYTDGRLYGITFSGGTSGYGVLYSMDTAGLQFQKHHDFEMYSSPSHGFVEDNAGKLWATTPGGGIYNKGTIFSFYPGANSYTRAFSFNDTLGSFPSGKLLKATDGLFYGVTGGGGADSSGCIFSFDPVTDTYNRLFSFSDILYHTKSYGGFSDGSLVQFNDSLLYGTIGTAGTDSAGIIYNFNTKTNIYRLCFQFNGGNGRWPLGGLALAHDGNMYGITRNGGVKGNGTVFKFDPLTDSLTTIFNFDSATTGAYPHSALLVYGSNLSSVLDLNYTFQIYPNPADYALQLEVGSEVLGSTVMLTDLQNRTLKCRNITNSVTAIDMHDLPAGSYIITVTMPDSQKGVKKFVKQ